MTYCTKMATTAWKNVLLVSILLFINIDIVVSRPIRIICPSGCTCRSSFQLVKCPDRNSIPTGSFSRKVKELDLRSAHVRIINEGSLTKYPNLKRLYLAGNPFDCTRKPLSSTQRELFRLIKAEKLSKFDGKSLRCATPRRLKYKRLLFLVSTPTASGAFSGGALRYNFEKVHGRYSSVVGVAITIICVLGFILLLLVVLFIHKDRVFKCILKRMTNAQGKRRRPKEYQNILNHSLSKDAKPSQQLKYVQLPTVDQLSFYELDWTEYNRRQVADNLSITTPANEFTLYMKEKMADIRRKSKGYPVEAESSDEEAWSDISLK